MTKASYPALGRCEVQRAACGGIPHAARCALRVLLLLAATVALPSAAASQWVAQVAAGSTEHDPVAASVGTRSVIVGVRHEGLRWGYLSAGAPLDSAGLPWAALGLGGRFGGGGTGVEAGADLFAHGHAYRAQALGATGAGVVVGALPFVAWSGGAARVEARSGVLQYGTALEGVNASRWVHDSGVRALARLAPELALTAEGRYARAEEGSYPFAGAGAELRLSRVTLSGYGGRWLSDVLDQAAWGVDGRWSVDGRTEVYAALEQEATDPLYWNDPRRSWSLGVSRSLGRAAEPALAVPVIPIASAGQVEIRLALDEADHAPAVAGDFNGWTPVPMRRQGDAWVVSLALQPGVYQYSFQRQDGSWFVPASVPNRVDDGFGGQNAVLVVAEVGA